MIAPSDRDHTIAHLRDTIEELREENRQLREQLCPSERIEIGVHLTLVEQNTLKILLARSPNIVSSETLGMFGRDGVTTRVDDPDLHKLASVHVCKIRKKVGTRFSITPHWGVGYSLDRDNAARLRELMARSAR